MKKFLQMMLLAALLVPLGARAQVSTIDVADGTITNGYVPVYGFYADAYNHCQIIYPAAMLTNVANGSITQLAFYASDENVSWGTASFTIGMAVVDTNALGTAFDTTTLTTVYTGSLSIVGGVMSVTLDSAYAYEGGNLLLDIQQTATGSYVSASFYGIDSTGASISNYSYTSLSAITSGSARNFIPKTSFSYTGGIQATCFKPTNLTLDTATSSSLTLSWTPGASESEWQIMLDTNLIENVYTNPYTIDNLTSGTAYTVKVRAICGNDTTGWTASLRVLTACADIDSLPWHDNFSLDAVDDYPLCWTIVDSLSYEVEDDWYGTVETYTYPKITSYYSYPYGYRNVLYYSVSSYYDPVSDSSIVASPYFSVDDPQALHVTFDAYAYGFTDGTMLQAGVMTDLTDASTFVPLLTVSGDDASSLTTYEFYTDGATALADEEGCYIAFRCVVNNSTYNYAYIYNVNVEEATGCRMPALNSGEIDSVTYQSVLLSWASTDANSYDVILRHYGELGDSIDVHYEALEDSLFITNLSGYTYYDAYVASVCGEDTSDYLYIGGFTTDRRCYSITGLDIAALTARAASLTWTYVVDRGIVPDGVLVSLFDETDSLSVVTDQLVTGTTYTFNGLTINHQYIATFRTLCGEDGDTANAVTKTFVPVNPPCAELDGSTTITYVPFMGSYNYGYTQSLYDVALLDGIDTLRAIDYEVTSASTSLPNRTISVYMGYTNATSLTTSNYVPVTSLTKVADNVTINVGTAGWTRVQLTTPFVPVDTTATRLVIAVENLTGSWNGITWGATELTTGSSVYWYQDGGAVSPASPSASNSGTTAKVPDVRFYGDCGSTDCVAPSAGIIDVDTASLTLSWLAGGDETSWSVQYRVMGDSVWNTIANVSTSPYALTGLTPNTPYQVRMGSECSEDTLFGSILTATTDCAPMHAPFAAVFSTTDYPCWNLSVTYVNTTLEAINLYSDYYGVVTPTIADSLHTLQVRVNARTYSTTPSSSHYIQVGACNADWSTIVWIDTAELTTTFADYLFYLSSYTGTLDHIIVRHTSGSDIYLHSVSVEPIPDCMPASDLTLDSMTTTEAFLSWTSTADNFIVVYKPAEDTNATWQSVTATGNAATISGLAHSTYYTFGVTVDCSGSTSDTIFLTANTECPAASVPFHATMAGIPMCWNNVTNGAINTSWSQSVREGYNYIYSYAASGIANDWLITAPIAIPTDAATNHVKLVYGVAGQNESYYPNSNAILHIYASTTGSAMTDFTDTLVIDTVNTNATLVYHRVSLDAYAGQTVRFAFRSASRQYGVVFLQDVDVRSTLQPLYRVYGSNSVFVGDTAVYNAVHEEGDTTGMTLVWYSAMAAAGQATILNNGTDTMRIVYTVGGTDSLAFVATNSYGSDTVSAHIRVTDLAPVSRFPYTTSFEATNTDNNSWVFLNNTNAWTIGSATASEGTQSLYISNDGGAHNAYTNSATSTSFAYRALSISDSGKYAVSFDWRCFGEGATWDYLRAWIIPDSTFNIAAGTVPDDTDNWIALGGVMNIDSTWNTFADSVTFPAAGRYFLTFMWHNDGSLGTNPPAAIDNIYINNGSESATCQMPTIDSVSANENDIYIEFSGEATSYEVAIVEGTWDSTTTVVPVATSTLSHIFNGLTAGTLYTVGVRAICAEDLNSEWTMQTVTTLEHPCAKPTNLAYSNVGLTNATLSWTPGEEESEWEVNIISSVNSYDSTFVVTTTTMTVNGLTAGATYTAKVKARCSATQSSDWSDAVSFTTSVCQPVTGVTVSGMTANSAVVSWSGNSNGDYQVEYGVAGFTQGNGTRVDVNGNNTYTITGLLPEAAYDVFVRVSCGEGVYSDWSEKKTFTTLPADGIDDVNGSAIALYPNPATVSVTLSGLEGETTVTIVDLNGREVKKVVTDNEQTTISLDGMAQGAYFVRITGEQTSVIRKLIVR